MQLLTACLEESNPIIIRSDVDAYDFAISVINTQLPMWCKLSSFKTMTKEDIAHGKMRLLESPGILNLENGVCLVYPNCEGSSAAFLEEKDRRNKSEDIDQFVLEGTLLRGNSEVTLSKIASFFFLFVNKIREKINKFYGENQPSTLDELREVFSLIASQYTVPLCEIPRNASLEIQATNHFFTGISNKLVEAAVAENSEDMLEDFFNCMRDNLSALVFGNLNDEKEYGGFFMESPVSIMTAYFPDSPDIIKKFKVRNITYNIPDICFEISSKKTDEEILTEFYYLNRAVLTEIDENNFSEELCQYTLHRLLGKFVSDPRCPEFVKSRLTLSSTIDTMTESLCNIIFDSHLIEVIDHDDVTDVNMRFAKAVEAVAIMWAYPAGVGKYNSGILEFKKAVQYMRAHPGHVKAIHQLYEKNFESESWKKEHQLHRPLMLHNITLAFLSVVNDPKLLGRLFNKGSIKKLEELAVSNDILLLIENMQTMICYESKEDALEKTFLRHVKIILLAIMKDFQQIFPKSAVFESFESQFTSFQGSTASKIRQIMAGLMVFEIFGLDIHYRDQERLAGGLNYWLVVSLTNDAISRFLLTFSHKNYKKEPGFYEGLNDCITQAFIGDCSTIKYAEVFSSLSSEFTTYIDNIFSRLQSLLHTHSFYFEEILFLQKSIPLNVFLPVIRNYLMEVAKTKEKDQLDVLITQIIEHDAKFFLQVIESTLGYEDVDFLIACVLERPGVIDIFSKLLTEAAFQNNEPWLKFLCEILYRSSQEFSEVKPVELSPGAVIFVSLNKEDANAAGLAEILGTINTAPGIKAIADIFNSALSFCNQLKLIAAIAKGVSSRRTGVLSLNIKPWKKIYLALVRFSDVSDINNIQAKFAVFKQALDVDLLKRFNQSGVRIRAIRAKLLNKLSNFEGLFDYFNERFLSCLGQEDSFTKFHDATCATIKDIKENNLDFVSALML
ncbi:MAG: hypothetical protein V4496_06500, partial [Pseudomonadota bacterium]